MPTLHLTRVFTSFYLGCPTYLCLCTITHPSLLLFHLCKYWSRSREFWNNRSPSLPSLSYLFLCCCLPLICLHVLSIFLIAQLVWQMISWVDKFFVITLHVFNCNSLFCVDPGFSVHLYMFVVRELFFARLALVI